MENIKIKPVNSNKICEDKKSKKPANDYTDKCIELKNIEYKTMLLKGKGKLAPIDNNNSFNIETLLDKESSQYKKENWNKLDNTIKTKKINLYAEEFVKENNLSENELNVIKTSLIHYLDRKMLSKSKEVTYNKDTGLIETIPILEYNTTSKRFTLKRNGKSSVNTKPPKTRKRNDKPEKNKIDSKKE